MPPKPRPASLPPALPAKSPPPDTLCWQDAWAVQEFPGSNNCILFGVFDGHGPHGRRVSSALAADLPQLLVASNAWKVSARFACCAGQASGNSVPRGA